MDQLKQAFAWIMGAVGIANRITGIVLIFVGLMIMIAGTAVENTLSTLIILWGFYKLLGGK